MITVEDYRLDGDGGFMVVWTDSRQDGLRGGTHVTAEWVENVLGGMPRGGQWAQLRNVLRDGIQEEDLPLLVAWWRQEYEAVVYRRLDARRSRSPLREFMRGNR
jgi:hypothetical protein